MTPDKLVRSLNGLRSIYAWSLLALHATNAVEVDHDGNIIVSGPQLVDTVRNPNYWRRQGRDVPEYLWTFRNWAFETEHTLQTVVASAEQRMFGNMVCEAYELLKIYAMTDVRRDNPRWQRFRNLASMRFARVVRNAVNHSLTVMEADGVRFPIAWRDLTFTPAMIGQPLLTQGFFDMPHAFTLVEDMASSARADFYP